MPTRLRLGLSISSIRQRFGQIVIGDPLITQDGQFFALNQNPNSFLVIEQDFEEQGNQVISQNAEAVITQDGRFVITQRER